MFKYRKDLVCPSFFQTSAVFEITEFTEFLSVEITNHGLQIKKIPLHSQYGIHESRLDFFCIPESRAQFLPNPGSRRTPSRPWSLASSIRKARRTWAVKLATSPLPFCKCRGRRLSSLIIQTCHVLAFIYHSGMHSCMIITANYARRFFLALSFVSFQVIPCFASGP